MWSVNYQIFLTRKFTNLVFFWFPTPPGYDGCSVESLVILKNKESGLPIDVEAWVSSFFNKFKYLFVFLIKYFWPLSFENLDFIIENKILCLLINIKKFLIQVSKSNILSHMILRRLFMNVQNFCKIECIMYYTLFERLEPLLNTVHSL